MVGCVQGSTRRSRRASGSPPRPHPSQGAPAMNSATLGIASDFVKAGIEKAGIPLTQTLEAYLSITFARFIGATIAVDLLTVRIAQALDANAPRDTIRALADECLIACAFFEARLRRNGTIRHYVGLGQMTYDAARADRAGLRLRAHARRDRQRSRRRRAGGRAGARRPRPRRQPDRASGARPAERRHGTLGRRREVRPALALKPLRPPAPIRGALLALAPRLAWERSSLPNSFMTLTSTLPVQPKVNSPDMPMIGPTRRHWSGSDTLPPPSVV